MDQATAEAILGFWLQVEYLQPSSAPDANPKKHCWNVECDGRYPWQDGAKQAQLPDTERYTWRFVVYAGLLDMADTVRQLRKILGVREDPNKEFWAGKPSAVFAIPVDRAGLVTGDLSVGSLPWAMGRIQQAGGRQASFEGFREFEERLRQRSSELLLARAALSPQYAKRLDADPAEASLSPLKHEDVLDLLKLAYDECGWKSARLRFHARVQAFPLSREREGAESEQDDDAILNSFIVEDIGRVRRAVRGGNYGAGLAQYLFGTDEPQRDVVKDRAAAYSHLWPKSFPRARWAAKDPLVFAQQFAVNAIFDRLGGPNCGLFSVNGPPGTGKTTLLRDVVAGLVVERAARLARLNEAADAFGTRCEISGHAYGYFEVSDDLAGYGVVVASANNGAVENVTRELPTLKAIDIDPGGTAPDYFAAVAETLLSKGETRAKPALAGAC